MGATTAACKRRRDRHRARGGARRSGRRGRRRAVRSRRAGPAAASRCCSRASGTACCTRSTCSSSTASRSATARSPSAAALLDEVSTRGRRGTHLERGSTMERGCFELAGSHGLEGVVAKQRSSVYQPDKRPGTWVKVKIAARRRRSRSRATRGARDAARTRSERSCWPSTPRGPDLGGQRRHGTEGRERSTG